MTDHFGINKQSKLFQKFINQKNSRTIESPQLEHKYSHQSVSDDVTEDNSPSISNRTGRSVTEMAAKVNTTTTAIIYNCRESEKTINNTNINPVSMIDSSLNCKNGLGLDQILRRAIQKVREGKIQDLLESKKEQEISREKKQKQSRSSQNEEISSKRQNIFQFGEEGEYNSNQKINADYFTNSFHKSTYKSQNDPKLHKQIEEWKLKCDELFQQNDQLITELQYAKQKETSLSTQNKKLKSEINKATKHSQQLQQQNQDQEIQIKELQKLVSQKQNQVKQKSDDANYWKNQFELQKSNIENIKGMLSKAEEDLHRERIESLSSKKDREQKETKIIQLSLQIAKIKQENALAKQYLYELTIKLYNCEQEIFRLRSGHLKNQHQPPNQQESEAKQEQFSQSNSSNVAPAPMEQKTKLTRNRQFNRERQNRIINVESNDLKNNSSIVRTQEKPHLQKSCHIDTKMTQKNKEQVPHVTQTDTSRQFRLASIEQQLKQIKLMAFINGKMRRRKIQLQRQLEQLKF